MPLIITHAAVGGVVSSLGPKGGPSKWWKILLLVIILANLPDIDFLLGLLFARNAYAYHYGFTHSPLFALLAAFFISRAGKISRLYKVNFLFCFLLILSHDLADFFASGRLVIFFHPLGDSLPARFIGFLGVTKLSLKYTLQEGAIIAGCGAAYALIKAAKLYAPNLFFLLNSRRRLGETAEREE
ncbi:MAG: metal-dependent hydrolase [Patescibacteria group bacterium]